MGVFLAGTVLTLWCGSATSSRFTHVLAGNASRAHITSRGCDFDGDALYYCDPIAIFVGRGHTGSANLAAYLQSHPSLDYGTTKEHRFFSPRGKKPLVIGRYRREFPGSASPYEVGPFGFDATPAYGDRPPILETARLIKSMTPFAKILIAIRHQPDLIMSQNYLGNGADFHEWTLTHAPRHLASPSTSSMARRWCHNSLVESYVDVFGRDKVLVLVSETMRLHRDDVLDEIHAFLGVDRARTNVPVMNVCKEQRYSGDFQGCYNGSSKVLPKTRAIWAPFFHDCNARLARFLGVAPDSLFAAGRVRPLAR